MRTEALIAVAFHVAAVVFSGCVSTTTDPAAASRTAKAVAVRHHSMLGYTLAEADGRLGTANGLLHGDDDLENKDVACLVDYSTRAVAAFPSAQESPEPTPGAYLSINGPDEFDAVDLLGGDVKVVSFISWCSFTGIGAVSGCARIAGKSIVVTKSAAGGTWAHEFGHHYGLDHAPPDDVVLSANQCQKKLMCGLTDSTNTYVDAGECARFHS